MPRHEQKDFSLEVPAGWQDHTAVAYASVRDDGRPGWSFVVRKSQLAQGDDLQAHAAREAMALAKMLKAFELLGTRDLFVAGAPAVQHTVRWQAGSGPVTQRITMVRVGSTVFVLTGTAPRDEAEHALLVFDRVLQSFRAPELTPALR